VTLRQSAFFILLRARFLRTRTWYGLWTGMSHPPAAATRTYHVEHR
jgi:hypothetical protein